MEFEITPEEAQRIAQEISAYKELVEGVDSIIPSLMQEHPNKWAAFDNSGMIEIADGFDELFQSLKENGIDTRKTVVRHLDPNPKTLIL